MKKIAVIGGGISGISCARLLGDYYKVVVFEKESRPGGLLKCEQHEGSLFHTCGGHVFNTKDEDVARWFWSLFNRDKDFVRATRHSAVCLDEKTIIDYPIENHVYQLGETIQKAFSEDLALMLDEKREEPKNFDEFLLFRFGKTLYDLYFKPYNEKVWRRDLKAIPLSWLQGKLPMPTPQEMREANEKHLEETTFVHSFFYYPKKGGSQFIIDSLLKGVEVRCDSEINNLVQGEDGRWCICGEVFDAIVYCGNIKLIQSVFPRIDFGRKNDELGRLESHGTTSVFCQIDENPYSWIYQPSPVHKSHRCICTGNFSPSNNAPGIVTGTIEFTDSIELSEIMEQLCLMPFCPRYIAHHYTPLSYPIQHDYTRTIIKSIKGMLCMRNVYLCGRFAEWEYYNMDVSIKSAMNVKKEIIDALGV